MEDILFDYHLPAIGQPHVEEVEAAHPAPPSYRRQVFNDTARLMEAARAFPHRREGPNIVVHPYGLPFEVWREPENPEGAIRDPLVNSTPSCGSQIRIPDAEIHVVLSAALHPEIPIGDPGYERRGGGALGSNQSPPTLPLTRANSPAEILCNGRRVPPRVQHDHLPPRCQPVRAQPLGQPYPEPPPCVPPCAMVEPLAGCTVTCDQCRSHRQACRCAHCRPGRPRAA